MQRNQLLVTNLDSQQVDDVGKWFAAVKQWYIRRPRLAPGTGPGRCLVGQRPAAGRPRRPAPRRAGGDGPSGPGLIVQIYGRHYHNADDVDEGAHYVRDTLIKTWPAKKCTTWASPIRCSSSPEKIDPEEIIIPSPKRRGSDAGEPEARGGGMMLGGDALRPRPRRKCMVKRFRFASNSFGSRNRRRSRRRPGGTAAACAPPRAGQAGAAPCQLHVRRPAPAADRPP